VSSDIHKNGAEKKCCLLLDSKKERRKGAGNVYTGVMLLALRQLSCVVEPWEDLERVAA
jgi:hypothetical protein